MLHLSTAMKSRTCLHSRPRSFPRHALSCCGGVVAGWFVALLASRAAGSPVGLVASCWCRGSPLRRPASVALVALVASVASR